MEFKFRLKEKISRITPFDGISKNCQINAKGELCKMEIKATPQGKKMPPPPLTSILIKKIFKPIKCVQFAH
jgi:hypothetical protein